MRICMYVYVYVSVYVCVCVCADKGQLTHGTVLLWSAVPISGVMYGY